MPENVLAALFLLPALLLAPSAGSQPDRQDIPDPRVEMQLECVGGNVEACSALIAALEADPRSSQAEIAMTYMFRADAYSNSSQCDRAVDDYSRVLAESPDHVLVLLDRAWCHHELAGFADAIADFDRAIELMQAKQSPDRDLIYWAHVSRGVAHAFSGNDGAALENYGEAIAIDPDAGDAYNQRAYVHLRRNDYAAAEDDVRRALTTNPENANFVHSLGDVLAYSGRHREADAQWRRACALSNRDQLDHWKNSLIDQGYYDSPVDESCPDGLFEASRACVADGCQY